MEHFRKAIELKPDLAPAHANLGTVLEELGDFAEAERSFREALRHNPRHAGAHAHLATMLRDKLPEADLAAQRSLLADPLLTDGRRSALHFGLAHVLDAQGAYAEAAEHLAQANALGLAQRVKRGRGYDPAAHERLIDGMIATCTPAFFERVRDFGLPTERPVFVVGLPRSGTTLIEQILASHSQVFGAGELPLGREDFEALAASGESELGSLEGLARLDRPTACRLAQRHLEALGQRNDSAERVVDKMPDNTLYLGLLMALFPRAKFIYCRRDLRDVAVSCWMTNFRHIPWAHESEHIAARFEQHQRLMAHWRQVLPVPLLEVDYEQTVADLEGTARRIVAWCGLDWEPACVEFHRQSRPVRTASVTQVRQPIYTTSVQRWKHYAPTLAPLFDRLSRLSVSP
jgi:tetratricopeptide (TPR) repeat protein